MTAKRKTDDPADEPKVDETPADEPKVEETAPASEPSTNPDVPAAAESPEIPEPPVIDTPSRKVASQVDAHARAKVRVMRNLFHDGRRFRARGEVVELTERQIRNAGDAVQRI